MNTWHHPINPSFTSVETPDMKSLPAKGYALVEEELASRELDEEILKKENELLEIIGKADENQNFPDDNNNLTDSKLVRRRSKNTLNLNEIELPPSSYCGLAVASVSYKNE